MSPDTIFIWACDAVLVLGAYAIGRLHATWRYQRLLREASSMLDRTHELNKRVEQLRAEIRKGGING